MNTGFITNEKYQKEHICPDNDRFYTHPERPERISIPLKYILSNTKNLKTFEIVEHKNIFEEQTTKKYLNTIKNKSKNKRSFDDDTYCNSGTVIASETAVYSNLTMLNKILNNQVKNGLVLSRPPGHHSSFEHASGFCIHNNIYYVANECLKKGLRPVIVDIDIHFGDGTYNYVKNNKDVLFISIHRDTKTFYPYKGGNITDIGSDNAKGTNINIPLQKSKNDKDYLFILDELVLPAINKFKADIILVSCGFDAHKDDILTKGHNDGMELTSECYGQMTERLMSYTDKILISLEGGYCISAIQEGSVAIIEALQGKKEFKINSKNINDKTIKKVQLIKSVL